MLLLNIVKKEGLQNLNEIQHLPMNCITHISASGVCQILFTFNSLEISYTLLRNPIEWQSEVDPMCTKRFCFLLCPGLDRAEIIGEIGSRSFYLRTSNSSHAKNGGESAGCTQEITKETIIASPIPPGFLLSSFIARKMGKIVRRTRRLWNFIICVK